MDEARARWRELAREDAGLGPIAAFHDERLASLAAAPAPDVAIDLTGEAATAAISEGRSLLGVGTLTCEAGDVAAELQRLARNLAETSVPGSAAQLTAERLAGEPLDVGPFLQSALDGDAPAIARGAGEHDIDVSALTQLLELALQPVLWEAAARCATITDIDRWDRGYCPVCGAWPALAELAGPERRRVLRCGRCGTGWSWLILLCPYCGNDDHRTLGTLTSADPSVRSGPASPARGAPHSERVDTCEQCRGYVKAIGTFSPHSAVRLAAEDVASVHLDIGAREAGYSRPGKVDVATAGIPRLVREGRTVRPS